MSSASALITYGTHAEDEVRIDDPGFLQTQVTFYILKAATPRLSVILFQCDRANGQSALVEFHLPPELTEVVFKPRCTMNLARTKSPSGLMRVIWVHQLVHTQ